MRTEHTVVVGDARSMDGVADESVDLVVTSPPYPMIELWDETFAALSPAAEAALADGDGGAAFEAMHAVLDSVWDEVARVLAPGGIACVNVGDATRTVDRFACYPNHARVLRAFRERGFDVLPDVLWRKPTNSAAKFMGSGMLPPNAYVTLEHEYVLVFRKGGRRRFEAGADRRYESAFFWEERNEWFSDVWTDVTGRRQSLAEAGVTADPERRERSAAYPFTVPYRLINMYSVYGDTVLDPFWGSGTTTLASMVAGRNSVGYELDPALLSGFDDRVSGVPDLSTEVLADRLAAHEAFVDRRRDEGKEPSYEATNYDTRVVTKQERDVQFYAVESVSRVGDVAGDGGGVDGRAEGDAASTETHRYAADHVPFDPADGD